MERESGVMIFSGGLDSTVALWWAKKNGYKVSSISFNYGQRHKKELRAVEDIFAKYSGDEWVDHTFIDLTHGGMEGGAASMLMSKGSQTGGVPVPHGHYTDKSMEVTVVPNRNMVFLALAAAYAQKIGAKKLFYGAHAGDHAIYADCRPEFVGSMEQSILLATGVTLVAPFIHKSKSHIAKLGFSLGAPIHLTWSCYEGGERHCGKCGTCVERIEAFVLSGVPDPTIYE